MSAILYEDLAGRFFNAGNPKTKFVWVKTRTRQYGQRPQNEKQTLHLINGQKVERVISTYVVRHHI